jgi:hypothetical protein
MRPCRLCDTHVSAILVFDGPNRGIVLLFGISNIRLYQ